jgi:hypothetical protein
MIIYNETVIVDEGIYKEWLHWIQTVHIPAVMATGCFKSFQILNVLDSPNEGVTYCVQYSTDTIEKFDDYNTNHLPRLQATHQQQFENLFVMFNTVMQTVN